MEVPVHSTVEACILFFNKADQTIECLESTRPSGIHVTLLNNGSSPESSVTVRSYCEARDWVSLVESPENLGVALGRNLLIRQATRDWLLFLDNDITIRTEDWLPLFAEHVRRHPDVEIITPRMYDVHRGAYSAASLLAFHDNEAVITYDDSLATTNMLRGGASFVRRDLFDRVGQFCPEMDGCEDWDLAFGALRRGAPLRARMVMDIELVHEHRRSSRSDDRATALRRYAPGQPARLRAKLYERHGVIFDPEHKWEAAHEFHRQRILGESQQNE